MMTGGEIVGALAANYFEGGDFDLRKDVDAAGFASLLVLVRRNGAPRRLFGLRFVDYPASPPTLRFWALARWTQSEFKFNFTTNGDAGAGVTQTPSDVATMCIPYHVDYYRGGWHGDRLWLPATADDCIAELVPNILSRA